MFLSITYTVSVEKKSADMRKQKRKQDVLILKMLPKDVISKLNTGEDTAENFESATLFFSSVVDFDNVTRACKPMEVIGFLNNLYNVMDDRMDGHDVYKVESISDSYLVASGLPKRNGDKYENKLALLCSYFIFLHENKKFQTCRRNLQNGTGPPSGLWNGCQT